MIALGGNAEGRRKKEEGGRSFAKANGGREAERRRKNRDLMDSRDLNDCPMRNVVNNVKCGKY
jgi:hypothetical protein